ncbi:MAG: hypothetical protein HOO06_10070 [Bdellovibrionaceae bacterium]|jgi:hypothetical protein|nr:hypothetical protein [Pseudobdellovibrionaceae bacterium]
MKNILIILLLISATSASALSLESFFEGLTDICKPNVPDNKFTLAAEKAKNVKYAGKSKSWLREELERTKLGYGVSNVLDTPLNTISSDLSFSGFSFDMTVRKSYIKNQFLRRDVWSSGLDYNLNDTLSKAVHINKNISVSFVPKIEVVFEKQFKDVQYYYKPNESDVTNPDTEMISLSGWEEALKPKYTKCPNEIPTTADDFKKFDVGDFIAINLKMELKARYNSEHLSGSETEFISNLGTQYKNYGSVRLYLFKAAPHKIRLKAIVIRGNQKEIYLNSSFLHQVTVFGSSFVGKALNKSARRYLKLLKFSLLDKRNQDFLLADYMLDLREENLDMRSTFKKFMEQSQDSIMDLMYLSLVNMTKQIRPTNSEQLEKFSKDLKPYVYHLEKAYQDNINVAKAVNNSYATEFDNNGGLARLDLDPKIERNFYGSSLTHSDYSGNFELNFLIFLNYKSKKYSDESRFSVIDKYNIPSNYSYLSNRSGGHGRAWWGHTYSFENTMTRYTIFELSEDKEDKSLLYTSRNRRVKETDYDVKEQKKLVLNLQRELPIDVYNKLMQKLPDMSDLDNLKPKRSFSLSYGLYLFPRAIRSVSQFSTKELSQLLQDYFDKNHIYQYNYTSSNSESDIVSEQYSITNPRAKFINELASVLSKVKFNKAVGNNDSSPLTFKNDQSLEEFTQLLKRGGIHKHLSGYLVYMADQLIQKYNLNAEDYFYFLATASDRAHPNRDEIIFGNISDAQKRVLEHFQNIKSVSGDSSSDLRIQQ